MRYLALATDYDGTLAADGKVDAETLRAVKRLKESGRRVILVTGRELDELIATFPEIAICDRVVAENGALLYDPATREQRLLASPPPPSFVDALKRRGVGPISVGRSIVATWEPHQHAVLAAIHEEGLELQVIFNKGAVMILPSGVNKATGLAAALHELGLSAHNVVAVGDAENDHAFMASCECAAAVANALSVVKERADLVTEGARGAGVSELIDRILHGDLVEIAPRLGRHDVILGREEEAGDVGIEPYGMSTMVCGTSGSGKSTLTTGLLERFSESGYQFLIIDPEGDYADLEFAVVLGSPQRAPLIEEVTNLLRDPGRSAVINLLGVALEHRPAFVAELLPHLLEIRVRTGRPHWLVLDEAHHLLPATRQGMAPMLPPGWKGVLGITVHPRSVLGPVIDSVDQVIVVGERPAETVREFCEAAGETCPKCPELERLESGAALLWRRGTREVRLVRCIPPRTERKRHSRKYAEGNLGEHSFHFRGPEGKLNLKAQNLVVFLQLMDGVDGETWDYHRRRGEYSTWFRECIKDAELADEAAEIERNGAPADVSRKAMRSAIERRYTLPADEPSGKID